MTLIEKYEKELIALTDKFYKDFHEETGVDLRAMDKKAQFHLERNELAKAKKVIDSMERILGNTKTPELMLLNSILIVMLYQDAHKKFVSQNTKNTTQSDEKTS